jgi:hypothetical protein
VRWWITTALAVLYAVVATRTGNLRAWCSSRTSKIGDNGLTITGVTAKIPNGNFCRFPNSIPKEPAT